MSTVLHRRELHVAITAQDAGTEFANASADVQAEFLLGLLDATCESKFNWPMQCRYILDEMPIPRRREVANLLETLVEHLREQE
jgi:hypothetical protein